MGKLENFLTGVKVLEDVESRVNGRITVIRSLAFGTYIQVANLTQSGGILRDVWRASLRRVAKKKKQIKKVLIIGLGGGTVVKLVTKFWPEAEITGIDIDPLMVELGRKYLKFDEEIKTVIADAYKVLQDPKSDIRSSKFDLVLVDTYVGDDYPEKFESDAFIKNVKKVLAKDGVAVFNRLYYGEKRKLAVKFLKKLENHFSEVVPVYPEANVMFVCES